MRHDRLKMSFHPSSGSEISGPRGRQGDIRSIRVRVVCRECNSGWMNRLEKVVRPFLTPLVTGEKVHLNADGLTALAQWIALKSIVVEHDTQDVALTPQSDRTNFMNNLAIPNYYRIYAAQNVGKQALFFRRHSHCIGLSLDGPVPTLDGTAKNIQVVTFVVGKAVFQLIAARIDNFTLEDRASVIGFHDKAKIWPIGKPRKNFPARPRMNEASITFISGIMERYFSASNSIWADSIKH